MARCSPSISPMKCSRAAGRRPWPRVSPSRGLTSRTRTSTNRSVSCATTARGCSHRRGPEAGAPEAVPLVIHRGGCHCGTVAFEVDAPARLTVSECNCSICRMSGYLHLIVPRTRFRLLQGAESLSEYTFNTGTARHLFCRHCGVKSFYVPRSNPDGYSVNVRCLERATLEHVDIEPFDDNDRAACEAKIRDLSRA